LLKVPEVGVCYYSNERFQQKAKDILNEFPDSEARKSLHIMLDYVIERKFE
jgi:octaprenyl-diphosphate synthase